MENSETTTNQIPAGETKVLTDPMKVAEKVYEIMTEVEERQADWGEFDVPRFLQEEYDYNLRTASWLIGELTRIKRIKMRISRSEPSSTTAVRKQTIQQYAEAFDRIRRAQAENAAKRRQAEAKKAANSRRLAGLDKVIDETTA